MNNEWITDRLPTEEDVDHYGFVWNAEGVRRRWMDIKPCEPWMRTNRPKPYEKPKRWRAEWGEATAGPVWGLRRVGGCFRSIPGMPSINDGKHREAAERIADIINEVTT